MRKSTLVVIAVLVGIVVGAVAQGSTSWWVSYYKRFDAYREVVVYHSSDGKEVFCSEVTSSVDGYTTGNLKSVSCTQLQEK